MEIKRLTIMLRVADVARADIMLVPERVYYRFATEDSLEDGELAAVPDFEAVTAELVEAAKGAEGEKPLSDGMLTQVFVNNRLCTDAVSEQSLRRMVDRLLPIAAEFQFLHGFLS